MLAIYIRVSTALQAERGTSLANQLEQCIIKAREQGFSSWEVYADEGYSGMDLDRPGIARLREDIASGAVSTLICWDVDRLARGTVYQLIVMEEFRKYKIDLQFVNTSWQDTPEGRLLFQMQSVIAEYELAKIKLRTTWGRIRQARSGKVMPMGTPPFGYDYDSKEGALTINENEARYVLLIYQWYVFEGLTLREMGGRLENLGVRAKNGGSWSASSLRRILQSTVYTGTFFYNKRETRIKENGGRSASGHKRREYTLRDPKEWIEIKVPALISSELYQLALAQAKKNLSARKHNNHFNYLFKGLLKCGECGRLWQAVTVTGSSNKEKTNYPMYRCPGRNPKNYGQETKKCSSKSISGKELEVQLWAFICTVLAKPGLLAGLMIMPEQGVNALENQVKLLKYTLKQAEKEKAKIMRLFNMDRLSEQNAAGELNRIETVIVRVKSELATYQTKLEQLRKKQQIEFYQDQERRLVRLLQEDLDFAEKRRLVEILVSEITVNYLEGRILLKIDGFIAKLEHCLYHQEVR